MTSHGLITDAENAIARGRQTAAVSRTDPEHEAAVELMACGLLVDRKVVEREVRQQLAAEIGESVDRIKAEYPDGDMPDALLVRCLGLRAAQRIVAPDEATPTVPLTCDGCGFDAPALYVDDPSGQRWCGTCKATVRDVPALPPQVTGATPVPPRLDDPTDPAGGES